MLADLALRPALRALAGAEVRAGGTILDFRGAQTGDITIGDVAGGDVIKVSIAAPPSQLSPQERRNRQAMLQKVRAIWVDGLLRQSLAEVARIELALAERSEAVQLPLRAQYQELERPSHDLPAGTRIVDAFDEAGGSLLILGAPGSGKTTLLLELCRDLLVRAEQDETQPIPVIFNLSSWTVRRARLNDWIAEELTTKYQVPKQVARVWIEEDALLPLLDGLDEVPSDQREACVEECKRYRDRHLVPLAVCSRSADYAALTTKLWLQRAILVQSLTKTQVDSYIAQAGERLEGLRAMLEEDVQLRELATTPLMLQVLCLSYADQPAAHHYGTENIWSHYIVRMLTRGRLPGLWGPRVMLSALALIAREMLKRGQSILLIEQLQPDWLERKLWRLIHWVGSLVVSLIGILVALTALGMAISVVAQPLTPLAMGRASGMLVWVVLGVIAGTMGWVAFVIAGLQGNTFLGAIEPYGTIVWRRTGCWAGLAAWLGIMGLGLLQGEFALAAAAGVPLAYIIGLGIGATGRAITATTAPNEGTWSALRNAVRVATIAAAIPVLVGLAGGLVVREGLSGGMALALLGLGAGIGIGMGKGGHAVVKHLLLRLLLRIQRGLPWQLARFLDACASRVLLRRVGGGYIFTHRLLMEHFAAMSDEEIARISAEIKAPRS